MIRQNKDGTYQVICSHCKNSSEQPCGLPEVALANAEVDWGFAVVGKFHFCPHCFSDMLERWKANNIKP